MKEISPVAQCLECDGRERDEYRRCRVACLAEIRREVEATERSCRRVATAAGTTVSIRAPGTARMLYNLVHRVLPRLSECPPRAPAVGMACNRPRVVVGAVCSASQSLAEHRVRLGGYAVEMPMISIELSLWLVDRGDGNPNVCGVTVTTRLIPVRFQLIC